MIPSLLTQLKMLLASLVTVAMSITPVPTQQGTTTNVNTTPHVGTNGNSRNWSGFVATNGTYTSITGTWTIPQVTNSDHTATDATWVGIGGVTNNDLIQSGTQNIITPSGQIVTTAFYELLPNASIPITSVSVKPGDSVTVTISQQSSASQWMITFTDATTNQNYQTTVTYSSSTSSAEWIEEAPSNGRSVLPLDNFGTVQFTNSATTQNGTQTTITNSNAHAITMMNNAGQAIAIPSSLGSDGESFSIIRSSAVSNSPISSFDRNPGGWYRRGRGISVTVHFIWTTPNNDADDPHSTTSPKPNGASASGAQVFHFFPRHRHFRF